MTCAACSAHVERAATALEGVEQVTVSLLTGIMTVTFSPPCTPAIICAAVTKTGYPTVLKEAHTADASAASQKTSVVSTKPLIWRLVTSLALLLPLMYVSMGHLMWGWPVPALFAQNPMAIGLYQLLITACIMVINGHFFMSGAKSLWRLAPNMDALVAIGSGASFAYSVAQLFLMAFQPHHSAHLLHGLYFESAAMILTLITLGKLLESYSKGKTTSAIRALMDLTPKTAHLLKDGQEVTLPVDQVQPGDLFLVKPGEHIPADGKVQSGLSAVNEAALTGESLPVDKQTGDTVQAGTINQNGALTCVATRVGKDTSLQQIIQLVEEASATKAPVAKIADQVSGVFVPIVMAIALVTFIAWMLLENSFVLALTRAISVLVISCPCALGLATPVAIMVGSGVGAKKGILFKTAASLEAAGKTEIVVLDKTGTVTKGTPQVTDVIADDAMNPQALLQLAANLEANSEHPLAKAILLYANAQGISPADVTDFHALPGNGIVAKDAETTLLGGNAALMQQYGLLTKAWKDKAEHLAKQGKTPLFFTTQNKLLGLIAVADPVKEDSLEAIKQLHQMGITVVMLTGDNQKTANAIAEQVGIDRVVADVMPDEKQAVVKALLKHGRVTMVGDGINDAPALTAADVGMAIGAGSDIAIDAADVVLVRSELSAVPTAIRLSHQVLTNIRQNLFWAFIYNTIGIPLAAGVFAYWPGLSLDPMFGAAAMSLSSFCVVTNALRLNLFNPQKTRKTFKKLPVILPETIFGQHESACPIKSTISLEEKPMQKLLSIEGMMCPKCQAHVEKALSAVSGVSSVAVDLAANTALVTLLEAIDDQVLTDAVLEAGYTPVSIQTL